MGRNARAKKPKKKTAATDTITIKALSNGKPIPKGEKIYVLTESEMKDILLKNSKDTLDGSKALLEYNMIVDNMLSPKEAKRQSNLMDIRAQAILDGDLTWEEIYAHIDEFHAKEEKENMANYDNVNELPEKYRDQAEIKLRNMRGPVNLPHEKAKRSKYGNKVSEINDIKFDSKKEGRRYLVLMDMLKNGEISDLRLQPQFTLIEGFKTATGEAVQAERYVADFSYINACGEFVVEDVKSEATRKKETYRIKKKQMQDVYGITITEV